MKKLRWGVIGAGGIADRRTIPGMMLAQNAELIAVMEINAEFAEQLRVKWNVKHAYTSTDALLADPEIDAVYIASPVVLHAEQAMAAADAGKHILLEKPLAMTAEEGWKVIEYCNSKNIKIAAGFMMRFGSHVQTMKKTIADGKIGNVVSGYSQFTCWYPEMPGNWRQTKKHSGGGALMDMGVHCIDLMQYITGSKVAEVAAFHDNLTFHYEVEDSSMVMLRLENGCQCVVQSNFNIPDNASMWRVEFFGDQGRLVGSNVIGQIDGGNLNALFCGEAGDYNATQDTNDTQGTVLDAEFGNMYTREIESFGNSVLNDLPLEVPATDAVRVQEVIEAAYRSNDEKRCITLEDSRIK